MRLRLFWKLSLSFLLPPLLALGVVYFYTTRVVERNSLESTFSHLESFVRLAESRPPALDDPVALQLWTSWMAESGARVTVIGRDGTVLADSEADAETMENHRDRPEVADALKTGGGRATRFSNTVNEDLVYLAVRVDWGGEEPVVLRVAEPQFQVRQAIAEVRGPMTSMTILVLFAGTILALGLSRVFTERVNQLREFSRRVAEGDFSPAPVSRGDDELGELAASLNDTAAHLSNTIGKLEDERNLSRGILSAMSEGVAVVDSELQIKFSNPAFRAELRHQLDEDTIKGLRLDEVTRNERILDMVQQVLDAGVRTESEVSTTGPDVRDLLVRSAPVGDGGAVVVLLDITDMRRLERVRRDFVANVSHELKTPLTAIQGFAETLLGGALDEPENSRRFATIIRDHSARLGRLTEDLLRLSRIEAGKMEVDLRPVAARDTVEQVVESARIKADPKGLALEIDWPSDMPEVLADPHVLYEVLQNLLDNAVQYTPEGRRIMVRAARDGDEAQISIIDDGIGIPVESLDRIFERFYRVDAARSRSVGGTGLGLAITKHLVESMQGRIEVSSQLGQGSTFTVCLPVPSEETVTAEPVALG